MRTRTGERGTTLLEAMVATAVLLIGAMGAISAHKLGLQTNSDARKLTRASAIAQDLVDQIALWQFSDSRLANTTTANDADLGDTTFAFESPAPVVADHADPELGTTFAGLSLAEIQDGTPFERYWNVATVDDIEGNGIADMVRVAVIVRWPTGDGRFRRIVAFTGKAHIQEMLLKPGTP